MLLIVKFTGDLARTELVLKAYFKQITIERRRRRIQKEEDEDKIDADQPLLSDHDQTQNSDPIEITWVFYVCLYFVVQ